MLDQIHQGAPQILIGTQMLAKGHHFPKVTLVGVLDADAGLFSSDFRATERLGQLLLQVAGRAGRTDKLGEVLIQTHNPDHPLLLQLISQGYHNFAETILKDRNAATLPPYSHIALFRAEANDNEKAMGCLQAIKEIAQTHAQHCSILGPISAPMSKRAGRYRTQLLLQSSKRGALQACLKQTLPLLEKLKLTKQVRWSIDVDPIELF